MKKEKTTKQEVKFNSEEYVRVHIDDEYHQECQDTECNLDHMIIQVF